MSGLQSPPLLMDEEESTASSFAGSPSMNSTIGSAGFDINYFLALANPDISSSSSESQSQGSRATSPSDWINMAPTVDNPDDPASWKFDTDALLVSGVDPNALILGEEQIGYDSLAYPPALQSFQFEQMIQAHQLSHQPAQTQSQYTIPEIIEPRSSASYAVHPPQRRQQTEHQPFIHAPQPQHPIAPPPAARVTNSGAIGMDADAIGRRVRELAGIEYAVTAASQQADIEHQQQPPLLPQLPQNLTGFPQQLPAGYAAPHAYSSPAPSSAGSSEASPSAIPQYGAKPVRTKTPHTTIERRYRTNLNARIVALRHAVPALRILEKDKFPNEKVDERGYVDGVKAARKASKGSILGKAAEYIGVLKKREIRLRRDYEGLRALIYGLVGGPELLAHWDHVWREQHPGDDEEVASDEDGDDDDGSDDDDDKPRKKPKAVSAPVASAVASSTVAVPTIPPVLEAAGSPPDLKRKRGRPRKNPPPVVVPAPPPMYLTQQQQQQQQPPQAAKYLMGVFLLFTFLNPATNPTTSNLTTSSRSDSVLTNHAHKHVGTVLTALNSTLFSHPATQYVASAPLNIEWSMVMQYAHALVTILLFLSAARNIVPASWAPLFPKFLSVVPPSPDEISRGDKRASKVDLAVALERDDRGLLARALGCSQIGLFDALRAGIQALIWPMLGLGERTHNPTVRGAVVRLAELDLMHRESMSISYRLYHASRLYPVLSASSPSSSELTTFCIIAHGLPGARSFAASTWAKAHSLSSSLSRDQFLFDRSLDDAVGLYNAGHTIIGAGRRGGTGNGAEDGRITPLGLIASALVCERIRDKASELFTRESPVPTDGESVVAYAGEAPVAATLLRGIDRADQVQEKSDASLDEVVALGRSLTKPVRELTHLFEDVAAGIQPVTRGVSFIPDADEDEHDALSDAKFFLEAILLYRRITSVIQPTSPTPSETSTLFAGSSFSPSLGSSAFASSRESSVGPGTPNDSDSDSGNEDDEGMTSTGASSISTERLTKGFGKASVGSRLELRRILGSSTFAAPVEINDARDRMVDFLVDTAWTQ